MRWRWEMATSIGALRTPPSAGVVAGRSESAIPGEFGCADIERVTLPTYRLPARALQFT